MIWRSNGTQQKRPAICVSMVSALNAVFVFDDPQHLSIQDRFENGEYRWQTIGLVHGVVVILVAHTIRFESGHEVVRIISARKADRKERSRYEHG